MILIDGHYYLTDTDYRYRRRAFRPGCRWDRMTECRNTFLLKQLRELERKRKIAMAARERARAMPRSNGRFTRRNDAEAK